MGFKSNQPIVWDRVSPEVVNIRYTDETLVVDPEQILHEVSPQHIEDPVLEPLHRSDISQKQNIKELLTLKELRRKFWHFRRRSKKFLLTRRSDRTNLQESERGEVRKPAHITRSLDLDELFDPSLQPLRLARDIRDLYSKVETHTATDREIFQLLQYLYKAGLLKRAESLINEHEAVLCSADTPDPTLVDKIYADIDLMNNPPQIPERGDGPLVVPEEGRILYCAASTIHYHSNGYATRTAGLVGGLHANGTDVVVAARPGYPWDVRTHRDYKKSIFHTKTAEGVEYAYSFGPSLKTQSLSDYFDYAVDSYLRLIEKYRPSHIHAASNHVTALPALIAARIAGLPFTYEVRGFWEYALQDTLGELNARRVLATMLEDVVLHHADHIFILSPEMKAELQERGFDKSSITVLPNGVDTDVFQPLPKVGDLVSKYGLNDGKINIGYAGSMVAYEGIDLLTRALLELADERNDFRLVLVGDGPVLPGIRQLLSDTESSLDVKILGRVAPNVMPSIVSAFDLTVAARKSTEVTRLVSPLKPLESMASGVPFLASDLPVLRGLVEESNGGLLFESMSSKSLIDQLRKLLDDPDALKSLGRVGRQWTINNRQWPELANELSQQIKRVTRPARNAGMTMSDITMGVVADEFTMTSLEDAVRLVKLDRDNWASQLDVEKIDVLFVESAWKGNSGQWHRGIGHYSEEESQDLVDLLTFCEQSQIPTIFWNKEDPVHFERFKRNAMLFDLVLTTDSRSVSRYQHLKTKSQQIFGSMPFFGTPKIHHPVVEHTQGDAEIIYAGSYYGDRYPDRSKSLLELLEAAKAFDLSIFDRQMDEPNSPYKFPANLQSYVRGGLEYQEMLEAYRQFPIHLNVNSVDRSETMFSRRVVEIGMSGGMVLSSPSVAMSMLFSRMIPQARDSQAALELLAVATASPELRNIHGWNLRRLIRRSHSVNTRLVTILRRVGINVSGLAEPKVGVILESGSTSIDVDSIFVQSLRPRSVFVERSIKIPEEHRQALNALGIELNFGKTPPPNPALDYIFHWTGETLDAEALEDAVFLAEDMLASKVYIDRSRPENIHTPLATYTHHKVQGHSYISYVGPEDGREKAITLRRGMVERTNTKKLLETERHTASDQLEPLIQQLEDKNILVAGHDFKFISGLIDKLESLGLNVAIDQWQSHNSHDEERSRELLRTADVVFCEWGLGNAVWYSNNVSQRQRLVIRVHSQELFRNYLRRLNAKNVDELIFVAPHIRDAAINIRGIKQIKTKVIPNFVRDDSRNVSYDESKRFTIGMVGAVPQQKGLDRALDLLELLRKDDKRFSLRIKGKLPNDYPWMLTREEEMAFYEAQYERIESSPLLRNAVRFDGYSSEWSDMVAWYQSVGVVISVSDFESFHFTLVDGPLQGALPVSLRWTGSDRIYPESWLVNTISDMADRIYKTVVPRHSWISGVEDARQFVRRQFAPEKTLMQLLGSLNDENTRRF